MKGDKEMTRNEQIALKENRIKCLKSNGKNIESNGVIRKLARQLRRLNKEVC